ncbi:MAG: sensor histidine kinase [Rhizobacter sp.]
MLWRVLVPLAMTWLLGTAVALGVAIVFASQAFDRSLLDDAYALAANVSERGGEPVLNLAPNEVGAVLFDASESVYFSVRRGDGLLVSGDAWLGNEVPPAGARPEFGTRVHDGQRLRVVTLRREQPVPFVVAVGQTTRSRSELLQRFLVASVVPQLGLLLLLGWWLRVSVARELAPLGMLQKALAERDSTDLTPLQVPVKSLDLLRLTQAADALMVRIDRGVQAQREFTGNVAHELRTPLAGIRALVDYGLSQRDPSVWRHQLQSVAASEQRATRLVDQLLALALADEARDSLPLQPIRIDEVVRGCVLTCLPRADAAGVDLGAVGLDTAVRAWGRVELVEGLVNNLLDNALRYGQPRDGAPGHITVELRIGRGSIVLSVVDNGPGMGAEQSERLRARWSQGAGGVSLGEGAGLGLAIVSRYAGLLGGRFTLEPGPEGKGLRGTVTLREA